MTVAWCETGAAIPRLPLLVWDVADWGLAGGFLLAAIPLILYFIERRRTPVVDWPAMRFFLTDLRRKIRWMQLKELLLILLRTLILVGLVAMLMRPREVVPESAAARRGGGLGAVILLDNSCSMAAGGPDESRSTHWDAARAAAMEILDGLEPGDPVQVATLAGKPAALSAAPLRNLEDARASVRQAALAGGNSSIPAGLDLAADLARELPTQARRVYLITDLQERGWKLRDEVRWSFVLERLAALSPSPGLILLDVGTEDLANRAVLEAGIPRLVAGTDREVELWALLAQYGDPSPHSTEVVLKVDGQERESHLTQVSQEAQVTVRFHHRFDTSGSHRVEFRLRGSDDGLPLDDVRYLAVEVVDRLPVLIVAGDSAGRSRTSDLNGEGDLLDLALAPRARGIPVPPVIFRPHIEGVPEFERIRFVDLTGYPVIVLADVPALDASSARLLEDAVRAGAGLLIFAGEKAVAPAYNQDLFREGRGVLPARLAAREEVSAAGDEFLSPGGFVQGHPALKSFGERLLSELEKIQVRSWWRTERAPPETTTIAELKSGVPYLLEKKLGRGRVVLCVTGARLGDSDLPKRPIFVPLIHGLADYLAAAGEDRRNIALGETLVLRLGDADPGGEAVLEDPAGARHRIPIRPLPGSEGEPGSRAAVQFDRTDLPGFYTLKVQGRGGERSHVFAANMDPWESDPRRLDPVELKRVTGPLGFTLIRSVDELEPGKTGGLVQREWWRPLLALVIAFLILEVAVTRLYARGRAPWRPREPQKEPNP